MTIDEALFTRLSTHAGVAALVATRIYPILMPQNTTLPAITKQRISGPRVQSLVGSSGLAYPRYQVDAWASTYDGAKAVADQVRAALDGFRGYVGTVRIGGIRLIGDQELYEEETRTHRVSQDFSVWHDED